MNFLQHYTLKYTPLSPVHIGTGDSYEPTNYVIDGGTLYEFDTGGAVAAFSERDRSELSKIVAGRGNEQMLKAVQKFFYDRRDALKPWAVNAIPVLDGVADLYARRIGQTANREAGGGQVLNKLEIDRTAYNPVNRQPVLFGSSIKGAIRTALLDQTNNKRPLQAIEDRKTGKKRKENNQELQQRLFQFRAGKFELDPLRLINLSDAAWQPTTLPTTQVYLAVNRKKAPVTDQQGKLRQAMGENLYQILECVPSCYARAFHGQIGLQNVGTNRHPALPQADLRYDLTDIARACNNFYGPLFADEIKLMQQRDYLDSTWKNTVAQLFKLSEAKRQANQAFLLRVGRHSGAEAVTISGARNGNIKIIRGKDQKPDYADTAKTLWLAANDPKQRANLLPFGWLLVEILQDDEAGQPWPELEAICAGQHQQAKQWAERFADEKVRFAERRQADEQRRKQEEQERRQREELARQEEQDRQDKQHAEQQRLASLSPIEKEIEDFLESIQPQEHDTRLLKELESGRWQGEDAKAVAEKVKSLMEQAGKWLPDFEGTNKTKVKNKERCLKVLAFLQG